METNNLFPIFLKLDSISILVVGGGNVALEKMTGIWRANPLAKVQIVSIELNEQLHDLIQKMPNVIFKKKEFEVLDLNFINLVIAATDNRELQITIKESCQKKGILCNIADTPDLCDFYLSSVVQKGNLKIAISTNGKSPTIAKRIKEVLDDAIPDEIDEILQNINVVRKKIAGDFAEKVKKLNEITKILIEKGL